MKPTDQIIYVSHSGGKDSQAMYSHVLKNYPHDQIVVVHSDLGEIEWEGVQDHIRNNISHPLNVVRAGKTFFEMVLSQGKDTSRRSFLPVQRYQTVYV